MSMHQETAKGTDLLKRYVSFSATNRSPTSKLGAMDREGMKRGSAMNLQVAMLSTSYNWVYDALMQTPQDNCLEQLHKI